MGDQCQDVLDRIETYLDGECTNDVEAVVRQHLADCPPCGDRADFQEQLKAIIASRCRERAPQSLAGDIMARLHLT